VTFYSGSNQGSFTVLVSPQNSCGSVDRYYIFNATSCGYFSYSVYPNPAESELTIHFEDTDAEKEVPEQFDLYEESARGAVTPVRSINTRSKSNKDQVKASRQLVMDVKDLPRGRYILRVTKEKEADKSKQIENIRVFLE
jgi:hypothetical protein